MPHHIDKPDETIKALASKIGYKGRKFQLTVAGTVSLHGNYWDGGSRSYYHFLRLADRAIVDAPAQNPLRDSRVAKIDLPRGIVCIEHCIFCGKDHGITVYVRPDDVSPTMIPAPAELSDDERACLKATWSYKASYNGISNYRQVESGLSTERWEAAKAALIARKLLNKRGAITAAGRNAISV